MSGNFGEILPIPDQFELRMRILKLRWIGLEDEAEQLAREAGASQSDLTLAGTFETD